MVGARPDGRDDLLRLGGGEDELQVRRWLLDQLQQRVEALLGDHVRLVDDVDLEASGHRRVEGPLAQFPGVVDAAVRGRVDLDHVDAARPGGRERDAGVADPAGFRGRALDAVQRAGEDPRAGRLAAAARPAEQVSVVDPPGAQRLGERAGDVFLPLHLGERRRTVLAVQRQARRGAWARLAGDEGLVSSRSDAAAVISSSSPVIGRTPRTPVRARVPLLPSGPGGVGGINAVRGVIGQCSQPVDQMFRNPVTGGFG